MHRKMYVFALHLWKNSVRRLPPLRHRIAHDVAGAGLAVNCEDQLVDRISQIEQLEMGLYPQTGLGVEPREPGRVHRWRCGAIEGLHVSPLESHDIHRSLMPPRNKLG